MLSTTGILTLSIHEALTFEGTEIAIHPDLFAGSSRNPVDVVGSAVASNSNEIKLSVSPSGRAGGEHIGLEVGDVIEIRVWTQRSGPFHPQKRGNSVGCQQQQHALGFRVAAASNSSKGFVEGENFASSTPLVGSAGASVKTGPSPPSLSASTDMLVGSIHSATPVRDTAVTAATSRFSTSGASNLSTTTPTSSVISANQQQLQELPASPTYSAHSRSSTDGTDSIQPTSMDDDGSREGNIANTESHIIRQIPMRREGSREEAVAMTVGVHNIITPVLEESAVGSGRDADLYPISRRCSGINRGGDGSGGAALGTNPQDGVGLDSTSPVAAIGGQSTTSSLSSSPLASLTTLAPSTLPPLPPSRQLSQVSRGRNNTGDNMFQKDSSSVDLTTKQQEQQQQILGRTIDGLDIPIMTQRNRARLNTAPSEIEKGTETDSAIRISPKSLREGVPSLQRVDPPPPAPAPVSLITGDVSTGPGHVRDISKLSVGSDFVEGLATAISSGQHIRESSSLSSVLGEHLVAPPVAITTTGSDSNRLASTKEKREIESSSAAAGGGGGGGTSGRVARSLMLKNSEEQTGPALVTSHNQRQQSVPEGLDMLRIVSETHDLQTSFVMVVTKKTLTSIKSSARTQISILRNVADLYHLSPYDQVTITKISKARKDEILQKISADFVLVSFKDQFISRGEMYHFQNSLVGRWLYEGVRLDSSADGIRANAMEIRHGDHRACSGIVTEDTKITFRSRSTRIIWLVQISSEMWEYSSPYETGGSDPGDEGNSCEIYFDKFVTFMHRLFRKWKQLEVTHSLTVVFFSRTYIRKGEGQSSKFSASASGRTTSGEAGGERMYEDHYKMVVENETRPDWSALVPQIKKAFVRYPAEVGWSLDPDSGRICSVASQGNLLESINITLNLLQLHYADRDLHRTGNSIVVVSAGCGVFEVDKGLASITKQRMMDNGIGSDMLSLTLPPLHVAPFFLFEVSSADDANRGDFDEWKSFFEVPHWMHLSYFNYDEENIGTKGIGGNAGLTRRFSALPPASSRRERNVNGFLVREQVRSVVDSSTTPAAAAAALPSNRAHWNEKSRSEKQQRHLISSRDFEDILEACRPRNRGESLSVVPSALALILPSNPIRETSDCRLDDNKKSTLNDATVKNVGDDAILEHKSENEIKGQDIIREWGTVDFIHPGDREPSLTPAHADIDTPLDLLDSFAAGRERKGSESDRSSHSSSFANHYTQFFGRSLDRGSSQHVQMVGSHEMKGKSSQYKLHIQPSSDLNLPLLGGSSMDNCKDHLLRSRNNPSDDSLSTMASGDIAPTDMKGNNIMGGGDSDCGGRQYNTEGLKKLFANYDSSILLQLPSSSQQRRNDAPDASYPQPDLRQSPSVRLAHTRGALAPVGELSRFGATSTSTNKQKQVVGGGIGAALHQYEGFTKSKVSGIAKRASMSRLDRFPPTPTFTQPASFGRFDDSNYKHQSTVISISPSPLESIGMPLGSEISEGARPAPSSSARALHHSSQHSTRTSAGASGDAVAVDSLHSSTGKLTAPTLHTGQSTSSSPPTASHAPHHHRNHHHKHGKNKGKTKSKYRYHRATHHTPIASIAQAPLPQPSSRRKAWVLNPFRQEDEDEVLAKKTHNRRRWSHVFPPGEIEFKRHSGPNWRSLCQPAVLPTTIDYYPTPVELNDPMRFQFGHYSVSLDAMDRSDYKDHSELLREMVRQRLIQDFQIVPSSIIKKSTHSGGDVDRKGYLGTIVSTKPSGIEQLASHRPFPTTRREKWSEVASSTHDMEQSHTLSMGHRIQRISYNPVADSIEVVQYYSRFATNDPANVQGYTYYLWCPVLQRFTTVNQHFRKYGAEGYLWNKVDNLICGDDQMKLFEGSRFRRIMFRIIPDNDVPEAEYVKRFQRFLDYVSKQLLKTGPDQLGIKIFTSGTKADGAAFAVRQRDQFKTFRIPLKKGQTDYEWMEIVMDQFFDTGKTYKIMFHWLVANAIKVEAQVQLIQRRCAQYGLRLISFPQDSICSGVQLHPFIAPILIPIPNEKIVESAALSLGFIDDGQILMDSKDLEDYELMKNFTFPTSRFGRRLKFPTTQYVHSTGTLFFRIVKDVMDKGIIIVYENRRYIKGNDALIKKARVIFHQLNDCINSSRVPANS